MVDANDPQNVSFDIGNHHPFYEFCKKLYGFWTEARKLFEIWEIQETFGNYRLHNNTNYNKIVNAEDWKTTQLKNLDLFDTQWPMKFSKFAKPLIKELFYDTISQLKFDPPSEFKFETPSKKDQDLEKMSNYVKNIVEYESSLFKIFKSPPTLAQNHAELWEAH
jgi:hypothetical protein